MASFSANFCLNSKRLWLGVALGFFLISQMIGLFLRSLTLWPQDLNYKYLLYGHTHVVLSGWVYAALFILIVQIFLPPETQAKSSWYRHYWLTQLGVLGMLIAFPLQGYKLYSISFSTLVILLSYAFAWRVWRQGAGIFQGSLAFYCLKLSFIWMALASLGPWSLGYLMVKFPGSPLYHLAVYFYLHFHYNGFFSFAILALALVWLEQQGLPITSDLSRAVHLLTGALVPAYLLSALWLEPPGWVYALAGFSAVLQLIALGYLGHYGYRHWTLLKQAFRHQSSRWVQGLFGLSFLALIVKFGLQFLTAFPYFSDMAYRLAPYLVIGYLHLVFLGFVTCFLFGALIWQGLLFVDSLWSHGGLFCLLLGLILSEGFLFLQGALQWWQWGAIPAYPLGLFLVTALMPVGLSAIIAGQWNGPKSKFQLHSHE